MIADYAWCRATIDAKIRAGDTHAPDIPIHNRIRADERLQMSVMRHPDMRVQQLRIGRESLPLLLIDNLVANPDELVELAASKIFSDAPTYYPGRRAKAPLTYQQFILEQMRPVIDETFGLRGRSLRFTDCTFSLVMTPGDRLAYLQRIPHIDSTSNDEFAMVHYLFRAAHGGTAFYRHRSTGYEFVDHARQAAYFKEVEAESKGPLAATSGYIVGDTPLYEQTASQDGVFNRLVMYRRTTLHSGSIGRDFIPDPNPRTGRLSLNGFLA